MMTNPLVWPEEKPRTTRRDWSRFSVTLYVALTHLQDQVRLMGGHDLVITSNATLTKTGHIAAKQSAVPDPGIAAYFTCKGKELVFACDLFHSIRENVRAVGKSVEYIRKLEDLGGGFLEAALVGFEVPALPAATSAIALMRPWWEVLGVPENAPSSTIARAYRVAVREAHPDAGGSQERFLAVQQAYEQAMGVAA